VQRVGLARGRPHDDRRANKTPKAAIAAATKLKKATGAAAAKTDPHVWIAESFAIAKKTAYGKPIGTANKTVTIPPA
jgi:hypothetical protein